MNTLRPAVDAPEVAAWLRYLSRLTSRASVELRVQAADTVDDRQVEVVEQLSAELKRAGSSLGIDQPIGRRLLSLRELLDSHVLTASAIKGCDLDETVATAMVQRGLDSVAASLDALSVDRQPTV
jgi:hypothetical protein